MHLVFRCLCYSQFVVCNVLLASESDKNNQLRSLGNLGSSFCRTTLVKEGLARFYPLSLTQALILTSSDYEYGTEITCGR
jgi:hypothetical protein